jgi:hypothetical protein
VEDDVIDKPVRVTGITIAAASGTSGEERAAASASSASDAKLVVAQSDNGAGWSRRLHMPVEVPDGTTLKTLGEAGAYILDLPERIKQRDSWQRAADLLLKAASGAASVEDATAQIEHALFMEMTLFLSGQDATSV